MASPSLIPLWRGYCVLWSNYVLQSGQPVLVQDDRAKRGLPTQRPDLPQWIARRAAGTFGHEVGLHALPIDFRHTVGVRAHEQGRVHVLPRLPKRTEYLGVAGLDERDSLPRAKLSGKQRVAVIALARVLEVVLNRAVGKYVVFCILAVILL